MTSPPRAQKLVDQLVVPFLLVVGILFIAPLAYLLLSAPATVTLSSILWGGVGIVLIGFALFAGNLARRAVADALSWWP